MHQELENLKETARSIIDTLGTGEHEVCATSSVEFRVICENNDISLTAENAASLIGIRSIHDGKMSFVTTNAISGSSLEQSISDLLALRKLAPAVEHNSLPRPDNANPGSVENTEHFERTDSGLNMSADEVLGLTTDFLKMIRTDKRVTIDRAEFEITSSLRLLQNSHGVFRSSAGNRADWYVMGMARDGEQVTSFDYESGSAIQRSLIESDLEKTAETFRNSVIQSLDPVNGTSYKGMVFLHPEAVVDLLGGLILSNSSGRSHSEGISAWKDKIGQKVASEALSVIENPLDINAAEGFRPFDREGILTSRHTILDRGILNFIGHNTYTARKMSGQPTGNASGSAGSLPGVSFAGVQFILRDTDKVQLLDESDLYGYPVKALYIKRFSGNADNISGNFSGIAKNSFFVESGIFHPVKEIMISGNLFDLANSIVAGSTTRRVPGGFHAPCLLVDGVSVTAG